MRAILVVGLVQLAFGGWAAAQTPEAPVVDDAAKARAHYDSGRRAYDAGEYERALDEFAAAQTFYPSARMQFNLAITYDRLGRARALQYYRAYLEAMPDAPNRADVEARIALLTSAAPWPHGTPPTGPIDDSRLAPLTAPPPPQQQLVYANTSMVTIASKRETTHYEVTLGGQRCVTPCVLSVAPGSYRLEVALAGKRLYGQQVLVSPFMTRIRVQHYRPGRLVAGGIHLAVGALSIATAALSIWGSNQGHRGYYNSGSDGGVVAAAFVPLYLGLGSIPVGISLMCQGDESRAEVHGTGLTSLGIVPTGNGASVGATFRF